ncbi:N-acetylmuramoyl-L-alanine amidase [Aliivibrio kagoshimensis]|uniref:N-acetylmuramoyl-L-alanine amidase n=1 Tax=Aliivibrio kagoshimensis TaxID=2910230 RepID=UPI003D151577
MLIGQKIGLYFSFLLWVVLGLSTAQANSLEGLRVWPSPDETRIVIDLKSEANFSYFTLSSPFRLVVDLKQTHLKSKLPLTITNSDVLTKIRKSTAPAKGTTRLVLELKKSVKPTLFKLAPTPGGQYGYRLVVDLPHNKESSSAVVSNRPSSTTPVVNKDAAQLIGSGDIVVAIDAGHGGEDPGSVGPTRKYEKHTTLAVSKKIAARINAVPGMKAVLTRRGDYFVNLNRRSEIARKNKAHLLVSVHADSFTSSQPRGGSVFVLNTRRANSEIGRWVVKHEEQSELLGGAGEVLSKAHNDKNLSQTLLDLQFRHSTTEGYKVASNILSEMGKVTKLHKREPVPASLAVLKSPDIPSVLVETGFISNRTEEKLLFQRAHQDKLAAAISKAIIDYFEDNAPAGTMFALKNQQIKHSVKRGESLSIIAKKYGTSIQSIKTSNKLKSSSLRIGQVLYITGANAVTTKPQSKPKTLPTTKMSTHVVRKGEYLGKIAAKYGVSASSIKIWNGLKSDKVFVGQKLKVKVLSTKTVKHKVKRGEFLGKIASNYGISVAQLRKANQLRSDQLAVGQWLIIPSS